MTEESRSSDPLENQPYDNVLKRLVESQYEVPHSHKATYDIIDLTWRSVVRQAKGRASMTLVNDNSKKSVEEYFALVQSDPDHRYEYIDGYIYMMSGGSRRHSTIGSNLNKILGNLLENSPCIAHNSDACVQVAAKRYVCPDITITCDPRDEDTDSEDEWTVINYPKLIVEILSPGTRSYDQGAKFELYQEVPTIQEYVIVDTKTPRVLVYRREQNNLWTMHILTYEDEVELTSINVHFPVAAIYAKTHFAKQRTQEEA